MSDVSNQPQIIKFPPDCTMSSSEDNYLQIKNYFHKSRVIKLDLSEVKIVDAVFIQLLITARLEAIRNRIKIEVIGNSEIVNKLTLHMFCHVSLAKTDNIMVFGEQ